MYDRDARRSAQAPVGRGAPRDDLAGMPADAIRRLQQSAGNHAVAALLDHRAPAQVMRLGTGEHAQLGGNRKVTINGVAMTEGEVITLGDFYANPDRIYEEKTPELQHLVDLIRQDRQYKEGVKGVAKVKQSQWENATRKHAPGETYQQLAFANDTHYGPDSRTEEQRKDDQADIFRGHMTNANFLPSGSAGGTWAYVPKPTVFADMLIERVIADYADVSEPKTQQAAAEYLIGNIDDVIGGLVDKKRIRQTVQTAPAGAPVKQSPRITR